MRVLLIIAAIIASPLDWVGRSHGAALEAAGARIVDPTITPISERFAAAVHIQDWSAVEPLLKRQLTTGHADAGDWLTWYSAARLINEDLALPFAERLALSLKAVLTGDQPDGRKYATELVAEPSTSNHFDLCFAEAWWAVLHIWPKDASNLASLSRLREQGLARLGASLTACSELEFFQGLHAHAMIVDGNLVEGLTTLVRMERAGTAPGFVNSTVENLKLWRPAQNPENFSDGRRSVTGPIARLPPWQRLNGPTPVDDWQDLDFSDKSLLHKLAVTSSRETMERVLPQRFERELGDEPGLASESPAFLAAKFENHAALDVLVSRGSPDPRSGDSVYPNAQHDQAPPQLLPTLMPGSAEPESIEPVGDMALASQPTDIGASPGQTMALSQTASDGLGRVHEAFGGSDGANSGEFSSMGTATVTSDLKKGISTAYASLGSGLLGFVGVGSPEEMAVESLITSWQDGTMGQRVGMMMALLISGSMFKLGPKLLMGLAKSIIYAAMSLIEGRNNNLWCRRKTADGRPDATGLGLTNADGIAFNGEVFTVYGLSMRAGWDGSPWLRRIASFALFTILLAVACFIWAWVMKTAGLSHNTAAWQLSAVLFLVAIALFSAFSDRLIKIVSTEEAHVEVYPEEIQWLKLEGSEVVVSVRTNDRRAGELRLASDSEDEMEQLVGKFQRFAGVSPLKT